MGFGDGRMDVVSEWGVGGFLLLGERWGERKNEGG